MPAGIGIDEATVWIGLIGIAAFTGWFLWIAFGRADS